MRGDLTDTPAGKQSIDSTAVPPNGSTKRVGVSVQSASPSNLSRPAP